MMIASHTAEDLAEAASRVLADDPFTGNYGEFSLPGFPSNAVLPSLATGRARSFRRALTPVDSCLEAGPQSALKLTAYEAMKCSTLPKVVT